jgi:hypothetical protein
MKQLSGFEGVKRSWTELPVIRCLSPRPAKVSAAIEFRDIKIWV